MSPSAGGIDTEPIRSIDRRQLDGIDPGSVHTIQSEGLR
jgi:hypothetical protein